MDPNVQLMIYVIPLLIGFLMVLPIGRTIFASFSGSIPTMGSERGRVFIGLIITCLAGMAVSFQTLWISSKISEGGNFCASNSILSCDDVIGNPEYNTDPFFGIPWGGIGAVVFSILLYLTYSSSKEPNADWASSYLKYGTYLTFAGFFVIAMLVYYEFEMGKICQYCTTAHFANIAAFIGFFRLMRLNESKEWNTL